MVCPYRVIWNGTANHDVMHCFYSLLHDWPRIAGLVMCHMQGSAGDGPTNGAAGQRGKNEPSLTKQLLL